MHAILAEYSWCLNISGVWIFLESEYFSCLNISSVWIFLLESEYSWCLYIPGVWIFLVFEYFWCLIISGVWIFLVSEYFLCLNIFGVWKFLVTISFSPHFCCLSSPRQGVRVFLLLFPPSYLAPSLPQDGEFVWDEQLQGIILGSFFWGYILTNLVGGRLAELVGGRLVMGVGVFGTAFLTVLSPLFAKWSTTAFIVLRVLEGMCEVRTIWKCYQNYFNLFYLQFLLAPAFYYSLHYNWCFVQNRSHTNL